MGIMYKLMKHRSLTMDLTTKPTTKTKTKSDKCWLLPIIDGQIIKSEPSNNVGKNVNDLLEHHQNRKESIVDSEQEDIEKRFTAEHILQLCKFLAEKSKGNKNLYKKQQSPKKFTKSSKHFHFQTEDYKNTPFNNNDNNDKDIDSGDNYHYEDHHHNDWRVYDNDNHHDISEALPLLSNSKYHQNSQRQQKEEEDIQMTKNVLSSRLSPDINALNISSSVSATSSLPLITTNSQQQQQQHQQVMQQHQFPQFQHGKRDILLKIRHQIFERKRLREKGFEPQAIQVNSQVWRPW